MRKLVFAACLFTLCSFIACGEKTNSNAQTNDTDTVVVDTAAAVDTAVVNA